MTAPAVETGSSGFVVDHRWGFFLGGGIYYGEGGGGGGGGSSGSSGGSGGGGSSSSGGVWCTIYSECSMYVHDVAGKCTYGVPEVEVEVEWSGVERSWVGEYSSNNK